MYATFSYRIEVFINWNFGMYYTYNLFYQEEIYKSCNVITVQFETEC